MATDAATNPGRWPGAVKSRRRVLLRAVVQEVEILNRTALTQLRRGNPGVKEEKGNTNREGLEIRRGQSRLEVLGLLLPFPTSLVAKKTEEVSSRVAGLCIRP